MKEIKSNIICLVIILAVIQSCAHSKGYLEAERLFEISIATKDHAKKSLYRKKIIKLSPDSEYGLFSKGYLSKNPEIAIKNYFKAIKIKSDFAIAYYNLGNIYSKRKKYDTAIEQYTKAIGYKSDYSDAYNNRGNAYKAKQNYKKAIVNYTKAIEINPKNAESYLNRRDAYYKLGLHDKGNEDHIKGKKLKKPKKRRKLIRLIR